MSKFPERIGKRERNRKEKKGFIWLFLFFRQKINPERPISRKRVVKTEKEREGGKTETGMKKEM